MSWFVGLVKGAFGGVLAYIAAGLAALAAILTMLSKAKKAGIDETVAKTKEAEVENVKKAAKVERDVATRKPSDKRKRLRDKWTVG